MRTHNLTKTSNTVLLLLAFGCIGYSWVKLGELSNSSLVEFVGEKIGVVAKSKNDVRKKTIGSFSWNPTDIETQISENDSIFTNSNSQAFIKLENESEVTISEQSLIHFESQNSLKIENGKLDVTLNRNSKPLNIVIGRKKISLSAQEASSVSIQKNNNSSVIAVTKGKLNITTENSVLNINSGREVEFTANKIESSLSGVDLVYPKARVEIETTEPLQFDYKSPQVPKAILVSRSEKDFLLQPNEKINLRGDHYQWGLIFDGEVKPTKMVSFTLIKKVDAPKIVYPVENKQINVEAFPSEIEFKWLASKRSLFELKDLSTQKVFSELVAGTKLSKQIETASTYAWRVKNDEDFATSDFSLWQNFTVKKYSFSTEAKTIVLDRPNQKVSFSWSGSEEVQFVLAKDEAFTDIVEKLQTKESSLKINIIKPGTYYWKLNSTGKIEAKKIIIVPSAPPKRAPKVKKIKRIIESSSIIQKIWDFIFPKAYASTDQIYIDWEEIKNAKIYEVEITSDIKGKKVLYKTQTSKPYIMWDAPNTGTYYYRVRYQDFWKRFSPFSDYAAIEIVEKIQSKKQIKPQPNVLANRITLFYQASLIDFEQDEVSIEGTSITGHGINIQLSPMSLYDLEPWLEYSSQYGKVFDSQDFVIRELDLGLQKEVGIWSFSAVLALFQLSEFEVDNDNVSKSNLYFGYSVGGKIAMPFKLGENHDFQPFFNYVKGEIDRWQLGLSYQYSWKYKYIPQLKISRNSISTKKTADDIKSDAYLLSTGLTFTY